MAFITFGLMPRGAINYNTDSRTKDWFLRTILQIIAKGKLPCYLGTKPSLSSSRFYPERIIVHGRRS